MVSAIRTLLLLFFSKTDTQCDGTRFHTLVHSIRRRMEEGDCYGVQALRGWCASSVAGPNVHTCYIDFHIFHGHDRNSFVVCTVL